MGKEDELGGDDKVVHGSDVMREIEVMRDLIFQFLCWVM